MPGTSTHLFKKAIEVRSSALVRSNLFSDPILCLYQKSIPATEDLSIKGLILLPYTLLPEALTVALEGTAESCSGTIWQKSLIENIPSRCWAMVDMLKSAGKLDEAIVWAEKTPSRTRFDASGQINLAQLYFEAGRYAEADRAASSGMELAPARPGPYRLLALIKDKLGDKEAALRCARNWANIASQNPATYKLLSDLLLKYEEWDQALETATEAVTFLPNNELMRKLYERAVKSKQRHVPFKKEIP